MLCRPRYIVRVIIAELMPLGTNILTIYPVSSQRFAGQKHGLAAFDRSLYSFDKTARRLCEGLAATTHDLLVRHNDLAPINRLPIEVLQKIFRKGNEPSRLSNVPAVYDHKFKVCVTSVCTRWRHAAIADTELWSVVELPGDPLEVVRLSLERSKDQPLTIVSKASSEWHKDIISQHMARIRSLTIECPPGTYALIEQIFTQPAPLLEDLTLRRRMNIANEVYSALSNFPFPRLRSLTLIKCRLPWSRGVYTGLKKLTIVFNHTKHEKDEDILTLFVDSPGLEHVSLRLGSDYSRLLAPTPKAKVSKRIKMISLRTLELEMGMGELVDILSALELPANIQTISVTAELPRFASPELQANDALLCTQLFNPRCLPSALFTHLRDLTIMFGTEDYRQLRIMGRGIHPRSKVAYNLQVQCDDRGALHALRKAQSSYSMHSLTRLVFQTTSLKPIFLYDDVASLLAHWSSITRLDFLFSIDGFKPRKLQESLQRVTTSENGSLPPLTDIRFYNLVEKVQPTPEDFVDGLLPFLQSFSPTLKNVSFHGIDPRLIPVQIITGWHTRFTRMAA